MAGVLGSEKKRRRKAGKEIRVLDLQTIIEDFLALRRSRDILGLMQKAKKVYQSKPSKCNPRRYINAIVEIDELLVSLLYLARELLDIATVSALKITTKLE